jgi:hypothetical protein
MPGDPATRAVRPPGPAPRTRAGARASRSRRDQPRAASTSRGPAPRRPAPRRPAPRRPPRPRRLRAGPDRSMSRTWPARPTGAATGPSAGRLKLPSASCRSLCPCDGRRSGQGRRPQQPRPAAAAFRGVLPAMCSWSGHATGQRRDARPANPVVPPTCRLGRRSTAAGAAQPGRRGARHGRRGGAARPARSSARPSHPEVAPTCSLGGRPLHQPRHAGVPGALRATLATSSCGRCRLCRWSSWPRH